MESLCSLSLSLFATPHSLICDTHTDSLSLPLPSSSLSPTKIISIQRGPSSFPLFWVTSSWSFLLRLSFPHFPPLPFSLVLHRLELGGHGKGESRGSEGGDGGFPLQDRKNFFGGRALVSSFFRFRGRALSFITTPPFCECNIQRVRLAPLLPSLNLFRLHQKNLAAAKLPDLLKSKSRNRFWTFREQQNKGGKGNFKRDFYPPPPFFPSGWV